VVYIGQSMGELFGDYSTDDEGSVIALPQIAFHMPTSNSRLVFVHFSHNVVHVYSLYRSSTQASNGIRIS
jgi:hypothetical protein